MEDQKGRTRSSLREILESFEISTRDFSEIELSEVIQKAHRAGTLPDDADDRVSAELHAFEFREGATDQRDGWGIYFGPMTSASDGTRVTQRWPELTSISADTIEYWKSRVRECRHPLMRMRYADLVWEVGGKVIGRRDPEFARTAIDSAVELENRDEFLQCVVLDKLERGLRLARQIKDNQRIEAVKAALIGYERRRAVNDAPGSWGRAFRLLVQERLAPLTSDEERALVKDFEDRFATISNPADPAFGPFAAKGASEVLAAYYRRSNRADEVKRVILRSGAAFVEIAQRAGGMAASGWLDDTAVRYRDAGLASEALALQPLQRDAHRRLRGELVTTQHTVEMPMDEIRPILVELTVGTLEQALDRIATNFVVDFDAAAAIEKEIAREHPFQALIGKQLVDDTGRPKAEVGSIEEDPDGRTVTRMSEILGFTQPFLREVVNIFVERHQPKAADLCNFVCAGTAFEPTHRSIILRGFEHYLAGDVASCAHLLVPQVEDAIRNIVKHAGGRYQKPREKGGGLNYCTLEELLREQTLIAAIGERFARYLRVVLSDPRGLNLRNEIAHGVLPADRFTPMVADRIVHCLLVLARVPSAPSNAQGSPTSG